MELTFDVRGWPPDGPQLDLDHERFSYAGKFVMTNTGKAVAIKNGELLAAIAFNEDRTDENALWIRYVTVREDSRGEGIGPRLIQYLREKAIGRGYERVRIAVNNPFAYEALYRAGFGNTGETTGIAELILEYPDRTGGSTEQYHRGLERFRERELSNEEIEFLDGHLGAGPPDRLETTTGR